MTPTFLMLAAFLILSGIVLFYVSALHINMGEAAILSVASIIFLLFLSGWFAETFLYGMWGIIILSAAGLLFWIIMILKNRTRRTDYLAGWPVMLTLFGILCIHLILYRNDFIQHTDEFHLWAAAVKYMLQKDHLPIYSDFVGGTGQTCYATSLFYLFFQEITGYNEQNMYVASTLLVFIGFLLPFSDCRGRDLKKILLYTLIVYIGLYSLYSYGTKNLYVDIPMAAWAGGLIGWWITREKRKSNLPVLAAGMIVLNYIKSSSGLLMDVYILLFVAGYQLMIEKKWIEKKHSVRRLNVLTIILSGAVFLASVMMVIAIQNIQVSEVLTTENEQEIWTTVYKIGSFRLPQSLSSMIEVNSVSLQKVMKTFYSFVTDAAGASMSGKSTIKLCFIPFAAAELVLLSVHGEMSGKKKEHVFYRNYLFLTMLSYCVILFFSYIFMFAYNLSVTTRSSIRYFSSCAVFGLVLVLTLFLRKQEESQERNSKYLMYGILFFFALGINEKYIPNMTALDKENVNGYSSIISVKTKSEYISTLLSEEDKVYFIYQVSSSNVSNSDLIVNPVIYYLESQVSNYGAQPWRFFEGGSNIAIEDFTSPTIQDLPSILTAGGYTYLWIYKSDEYLRENLPQVLTCEEDSLEAGLYQVIYENGTATGLKLAYVFED